MRVLGKLSKLTRAFFRLQLSKPNKHCCISVGEQVLTVLDVFIIAQFGSEIKVHDSSIIRLFKFVLDLAHDIWRCKSSSRGQPLEMTSAQTFSILASVVVMSQAQILHSV